MLLYLDTNIMIAYFDANDSFHDQARKLFAQSDLKFYTSYLTVLEFQSVIGRLRTGNKITFDNSIEIKIKKFPKVEQVRALTEYAFKKISVIIFPLSSLENVQLNDEHYVIPNEYSLALKISPEFNLRTLDTIHLAGAIKIKKYGLIDLGYFLTNDNEILKSATQISTKLNITPISSEDLIQMKKI